jgi:predicted molibdopterin-dependent oxidoreductase YjgC
MNIVINGRPLFVTGRPSVLEAARRNGFDIPSLCEHRALLPYGACRICLVEIKGRRGYAPACSTSAEEGMEIVTESPALAKLRRGVLELILAEHPNACLICTEKKSCDEYKSTIRKTGEVTGCVHCPVNGRCELQRVVEMVGVERVPYPARRREGEVLRADPFIDRDNSLCILCGRCVRVCREVRGASVLTFVARGSETLVGTALGRTMLDSGCQFCGACVDVCPTGSLVERAARPEPLPDRRTQAVCPLCSLGCTLDVHSHAGRLLFTAPSELGSVNKGQGCVKGRFALRAALTGGQRILRPHIRKDGELAPASWEEALYHAAERLKIVSGRATAYIVSAQSPLEEMYVIGKWGAAVGAGACSVASPSSPTAALDKAGVSLDFRLDEIAAARTIVLLGLDPAVSHPLVWLEIWKALNAGARLLSVGNLPQTAGRHFDRELRPTPGCEASVLVELIRVLLGSGVPDAIRNRPGFEMFRQSLAGAANRPDPSLAPEEIAEFCREFRGDGPVVFLVGRDFFVPAAGPETTAALLDLALTAQARLIPLAISSNGRGWLNIRRTFETEEKPPAEIVKGIRSGTIRALYLAGRAFDLAGTRPAVFIGQGPLWNEALLQADIVFPSCTVLETPGSFINAEGRLQSWNETLPPPGESKPGWWITAALARELDFKGFRFDSAADVAAEVRARFGGGGDAAAADRPAQGFLPLPRFGTPMGTDADHPFLLKVAPSPDLYRGHNLAEEISGLRKIRRLTAVWMNPDDAAAAGVRNGDAILVATAFTEVRAEARIHPSVPRRVLRASARESLSVGIEPARMAKVS